MHSLFLEHLGSYVHDVGGVQLGNRNHTKMLYNRNPVNYVIKKKNCIFFKTIKIIKVSECDADKLSQGIIKTPPPPPPPGD